MIHKKTARKQSQRNGEKLEGIPAGIHPALKLQGNGGTQDHIQIGIHQRNKDPANDLSHAPQNRALGKSQKEILCSQRKQHSKIDYPDSVLRRRKEYGQQTSGEGCNSCTGAYRS